MGFLRYEPCPKCVLAGRDSHGDNLGVYSDGSAHCFAGCGYHVFPKRFIRKEIKHVDESQAVLPPDFTRTVPARAWKWLLQYGLSYSYWSPICGYSERDERLIFTFGAPTRFSIGRYIGPDPNAEWGRTDLESGARQPRKWWFYGDGHSYVELIGAGIGRDSGPIVLVEDIVSAHKVGQVTPALCLFGTNLHDVAIRFLMAQKRPVVLWLDADQYPLLLPKINRLSLILDTPARFIKTPKDPKGYSVEEIKNILTN